MKLNLKGRVLYANGVPVPAVVIHIFDKDAAGKQDDDLTVSPGLSDEQGRFRLTYEPLRFLDYLTIHTGEAPEEPFNLPKPVSELRLPDLGDVYLPYMQFDYNFNGQLRQHSVPLGLFQKDFYLPENPPIDFLPSTHGFKFSNSFSGYFLPFSTPAFMGRRKVSAKYGLCGGMCAAVYDFALAGIAIPDKRAVPNQGTCLQRYLFQRQMDSLGGAGQQVIKVAQWTSMPDDTLLGTQAQTAREFSQIRHKLEDKNPVVLALIYERAASLRELARLIFDNHQVLAYSYHQDDAGVITVNVYDPNLPLRDNVVIRCEPVVVGGSSSPEGTRPVMGMKCTEMVAGAHYRVVRGFFAMPYEPVLPPKRIK